MSAEDVKSETKPEVVAFDEPIPTVHGKSPEEVETLLGKAVKQVQFYFSDSNLPIDKYFFTLTQCNPEGWVPIRTICTFTRMREISDLGTPFVVYALRRAAAQEGDDPLVVVSEDGKNVRRKRELKKEGGRSWDRSAYVKGFGEGDEEYNKLDKLEAYFAQFGSINAIRMRREEAEGSTKHRGAKFANGKFKGSVFVEFGNDEDFKKFIDLPEIPKFREEGDEMLKMTKEAYVQMKMKEKGIEDTKIYREGEGGGGGGGHQKSGGKWNAFRELEKQAKGHLPDFAKIPDTVEIVGTRPKISNAAHGKGGGKNKREREEDDDEDEKATKAVKQEPLKLTYKEVELDVDPVTGEIMDKSKVPFGEQSALKMVGGSSDPLEWRALKTKISENGLPNPFFAYPPGAASASVCKADSSAVTDEEIEQLKAANLQFGGKEVEWHRMTEEELRHFWSTRAQFQATQIWKAHQAANPPAPSANGGGKRDHKGGRGGQHHGGRGGGRGGRRGTGGRGGRGGFKGGRDQHSDKKDSGGMPPMVAAASSGDA